ncbi:MAG: hypothetical protein D6706_05665, partial [Chloroflexi bacterium]
PIPSATPFYTGPLSPPCGLMLPLLPQEVPPQNTPTYHAEAIAELEAIMPSEALPAWQRLLNAPDTVGLAFFRVGDEANGVYLNADRPMPLASVVKVIHLVAFVEAVADGELNVNTFVPLAELERFYLPNSDLGAHTAAIQALEEEGRVFGTPPGVTLGDVAWMMIRYSSNAATDYLHMLLSQKRLEETAVSLNLSTQTAPCPFLGQFLAMGNHTRTSSNRDAIRRYLNEPAQYGTEAMQLTDAFSQDSQFRQAEILWRSRRFGPDYNIQEFFTTHLNPHASPRDYANLMARIATNGLRNGESSFQARRYLEWPMQFPVNQELFSNLGYKNGSLPGVLTVVYYAYRPDSPSPLVIALFYESLPRRTYQQWRRTLPHDELARWLLAEPTALPLLRQAIAAP